ncbi:MULTISPECIES: BBE domain-containing protein [unclassified Micromonospora]|uniref:BBE domain-containing protein n=1 Tax=Micromonospora sp. NPDC005206 TaxID=3157022 RepID=UPI0033BB4C65
MPPDRKFLTPVFGTSCPPKGLSGVIRRYSSRRYSEGRAAHWLLLLAADNFNRLRKVKAKYDPHNVFQYEQSIPPATL